MSKKSKANKEDVAKESLDKVELRNMLLMCLASVQTTLSILWYRYEPSVVAVVCAWTGGFYLLLYLYKILDRRGLMKAFYGFLNWNGALTYVSMLFKRKK